MFLLLSILNICLNKFKGVSFKILSKQWVVNELSFLFFGCFMFQSFLSLFLNCNFISTFQIHMMTLIIENFYSTWYFLIPLLLPFCSAPFCSSFFLIYKNSPSFYTFLIFFLFHFPLSPFQFLSLFKHNFFLFHNICYIF